MVHYQVRSTKLGNKLFLNKLTIKDNDSEVANVHKATNHVFCCDISGSMWGSLAKMRNQLKNRIPDIVHQDDTVTIIVFSGRKECTTLKELVHVNNVNELKSLNDAIDRYMTPQGMTCFLDPVQVTNELISKNPNGLWSWIFLSDGGNNDCPWVDVLAELEKLEAKVGSATIIEYGYYADTEKLSEMAETLGGTKIQASDFDSYVPVIEAALKSETEERKVVDISSIKHSMKYQQFVYLNPALESVTVISSANKSEILIPVSVNDLLFLSEKSLDTENGAEMPDLTAETYAMAYVTASYMRYDVTEEILAAIKDAKFIDMYCNAFGKQKLFEFQQELIKAVYYDSMRGEYNADYKPNPKAYCVLDLLEDLQSGDNRVRVVSPEFAYKRIGAKSEVKQELTAEQREKLADAKTKLQASKIQAEIEESGVKMAMVDRGYPISDFTWNEERANLSALMKIDVELELPKNNVGLTKINSFVFRNYTIIKDGILNVNMLPVELDKATADKLFKKGVIAIPFDNATIVDEKHRYYCLDFSNLPIVNKQRTKSVKASEMTEEIKRLTELRFQLKYLGFLKKKFDVTSESTGTGSVYTADQIAFLSSLGITDKGYSPKTELNKSGDFYMALALKSVVKGFSSIPKIEDVDKKLSAGKPFTPSESFMRNTMAYVDSKYLDEGGRDRYTNALRSAFDQLSLEKDKLLGVLSRQKFALILSKKWFSDKNGFEDNVSQFEDQFGVTQTIEYKFTEVKQNL